MIVVSPSILASNFLQLENEINTLNKEKDIWLHLDIMDGHFVPNLTFGHEIIKRITEQSKNPTDVHLMVDNPEFYVDTLKDYNIHNLTWHYENQVDHLKLINKAKSIYSSVGLSIKPNTEKNKIPIEILKKIDVLLIMSVEPGFGGQKFIENTYDKIEFFNELKKNQNLSFTIQVDGGVNDKNSPQLIQSGAQNLVAGSFIFQGNVGDQINKLRSR